MCPLGSVADTGLKSTAYLSCVLIGTGNFNLAHSVRRGFADSSRRRSLGKIVKIERYLLTVDGDLKDAIDEVIRHHLERSPEPPGLQRATDIRQMITRPANRTSHNPWIDIHCLLRYI
jgi:hypothetical protein